MLRGLILAAALCAVLSGVRADEPFATVTILEGEALVYRGTGRIYGAEGLRLAHGDIVHSGDKTFVQIEFADKTVAQLGPSTRLMVNASTLRKKADKWLYLMEGWAKLSGTKAEGDAGFHLRTPLVEIPASPGTVVVRGSPADVTLFVERGDARVAERPSGPTTALKGGDHYVRKAGSRGTPNPGAMQAFLQEMPRFFRDSLPSRLERWRDRPAPVREAQNPTYADLESWLKAEPSVRRPLVPRFRAKAREPAFRAALVANLNAHPEWDPILFPEKYLPKEPPASATAASPGR
jgi:hypothetical protein